MGSALTCLRRSAADRRVHGTSVAAPRSPGGRAAAEELERLLRTFTINGNVAITVNEATQTAEPAPASAGPAPSASTRRPPKAPAPTPPALRAPPLAPSFGPFEHWEVPRYFLNIPGTCYIVRRIPGATEELRGLHTGVRAWAGILSRLPALENGRPGYSYKSGTRLAKRPDLDSAITGYLQQAEELGAPRTITIWVW